MMSFSFIEKPDRDSVETTPSTMSYLKINKFISPDYHNQNPKYF